MSVYYFQNATAALTGRPQCSPLQLSRRQIEVLRLLGEGLSTKLIARALGISGHTVKQHTQCVLAELGAVSRLQAVIYAHRRGILSFDSRAEEPAGARAAVGVGAGFVPLPAARGKD